ncbi:MAG: translocation/assembly module TamB domain-containing protein [Candidatus Binatia bacterium]
MKRLAFGSVILALCAVVGLFWFGWHHLTELARGRLEREIARAIGLPCRIRDLNASVMPLALRAGGIVVGSRPPVAKIAELAVQVAVRASISEWRPVLVVEVLSPMLDLTRLPKLESASRQAVKPQGGARLPIRVKTLEITRARLRFRMGNDPARLTIASVQGHGETELSRRQVTAGMKLHGVHLRRKAHRLALHDIRMEGGFGARGLFVDTASIVGERIKVSVHATPVAHRYAATATFDPQILGIVVDDLAFVAGQARLEGTLTGDAANPDLDGHLVVRHGTLAGHPLGDLQAHVSRQGSRLRFDDVHLVHALGQVRGAVALTLDNDVAIYGKLHWQAVDLARLLAVIGPRVPFTDRLDGTTSLHGSLDPTDLTISGTGAVEAGAGPRGTDIASWEVRSRVRQNSLSAELELTQAAGNRASSRLLIDGSKLRGSIKVKASDLTALAPLLPQPLSSLSVTGRGEGAAQFSGTVAHPVLAGTIALHALTVGGATVPRLDGDFSIAGARLTSRGVRIDTRAGSASLSGAVALSPQVENDWRLSLHDLDTDLVAFLVRTFGGSAVPLGGGVLSGTVVCHGPWLRAETETTLSLKAARIAGELFRRVDVRGHTRLPEWTLRLRAVHVPQETVVIDGMGRGRTHIHLTIDSTKLNIARFLGAGRSGASGQVVIHGRVSGTPLQPDGWLEVNGSDISLRGHLLGDVQLRARGEAGKWNIRGTALARTLTAVATLDTGKPWPYTLAARWQNTSFRGGISRNEPVRVTTSGTVDLSGSLQHLTGGSGRILLTALDLKRDDYHVTAAEPVRVEIDQGHVRIRSLVLVSQQSQLTVTGDVTPSGQVHLDARGQGDLALLEVIGRPFAAARGQFSLAAQVRRTPEAGWYLTGKATARDAVLDVGLPVVFTKTNAAVQLTGSAIRIDTLAGKVGGGDFRIGGTIDLARGPQLSWTLHDVAVSPMENLEARLTGEGTVDGSWQQIKVGGTIEVLNALYDRDIELPDLLPWFTAQIAPAGGARALGVEVDLDLIIYSPGEVYVDNNVAKVELWLDLQVAGTTDKPVFTGTIGFLNGEVGFHGRTFTITGGTIDFRDRFRINPVLNITAESRIATADTDYTVTATVTGTASDPRVQFSADDPNLSQTDVVSLVAVGKTSVQLQREGGGVSAADALALLPTGRLEKQLGQLVGVERFEIEATQSRDTGAIEPRVTIGKDLTDRFRASLSTSFGVDARRSVQLEYRIAPRISLLGSWEGRTRSQAGAFGGDVKFRYDFRRLPFSLLSGDPRSGAQVDAR